MNYRNIFWEVEFIFLLYVFLYLKFNEKNIILVNKFLVCLFLLIYREYNNYVFVFKLELFFFLVW